MKIFVSWSGELSKQVAQVLKTWLPCIIQSLEIFYSPEDIEKGENWDTKISNELCDCNYGIICLTSENTNAPWIHFEAGALAKTFDSRVAALMINVNPSDIKGPLSRYQATRLNKEDFYQLIQSINKVIETPLDSTVLQNLFNALWDQINNVISQIISATPTSGSKNAGKDHASNAPLEEILQLLRKQNALLSNPEDLLPPEYFHHLQRNVLINRRPDNIIPNMIRYLEDLVERLERYNDQLDLTILEATNFEEIFILLQSHLQRNFPSSIAEKYDMQLHQLQDRYKYLVRSCEPKRILSAGIATK